MEYISLGHNCASVAHYVKNNLMKSKIDGRKTGPFDLMISTYSGVCNLLENNFEDFLNVESIDNITNKKYDNPANKLFYSNAAKGPYNNGMICNKRYGLLFNHESPGHPFLAKMEKWSSVDKFTENNFEEFKIRFRNRIDNFNYYIANALEKNLPIVFLLNTYVTPIRLCDIIKSKYPTLKFKILCNKMDDDTITHINNFESDVCNYKCINEKSYDSAFKDEHIVMDGWSMIDSIVPTLL